ncbi:MAG: SPASM domain-containing protein, partial [Bacillota bacterium]|nr:SPASM domain-containing protein [Bacillota bacterium]
YINRVHTNKRMDWNTAKKAIDFLHEHSECSSQVAFGFYGGEPLLEFELIKKSVGYINQKFFGKRKTFVITTNATLLNEEKLRFFMENDFSIMISLDGPESVQDGNRVFADNESGTFETIIEKLKMIEKIAPDYLEKISFNAVIDLQHNFNEANDFYLTYDLVKDSMVRGTFVNDINKKEAMQINKQYLIDSKYEEFRTMLYYCTDIFSKYSPRMLRSYVEGLKQNFAERDIVKADLIQKSTAGGQCVPGIQRLFVTVDGKLFPCERVNEQSEDFCIGDLENGFDIIQAKKLLNVGQLTKTECQSCWCQKICSQCIARADDNGKLSRKRRLENCNHAKASAEKMIKDYIVLKKNKCRFDNLEVEV